MSAGLERRVQKLEEEFERAFAPPVRIRLYWVDPETGESEPAWSDEEEAEYQRKEEEEWGGMRAREDGALDPLLPAGLRGPEGLGGF